MALKTPYLYVRGLRQSDHTVFGVGGDGQKRYYDAQFERSMPYSSGQQVKRSILDLMCEVLGEPRAPITFNYEVETSKGKKGEPATETLANKEPWSPCDPRFADQLIGGWMRARPKTVTLKRRSPLSISALRPLHPLLATMSKEDLTFDRSEHPDQHVVRVLDPEGEEMSQEAINTFLKDKKRTIPLRHWIPENRRTSGLFVFDVAIDLPNLFRVSTQQYEPQLDAETLDSLRADGWVESADGLTLVAPQAQRERIVPALAHALVNWRVTSNQSRTFSPQPTLALALSPNANKIVGSIRADLDEEQPDRKAHPVLHAPDGVDLYTAPAAKGYVPGASASADALDDAEAEIVRLLEAFDYQV